MPTVYGNLAGPHYHVDGTTQMERLAHRAETLMKTDSFEIWYDRDHDFHHLKFIKNGHIIDIRYYKAFSVDIDGTIGWIGCPFWKERQFMEWIADETSDPIPV